jgi:hypothetical protein
MPLCSLLCSGLRRSLTADFKSKVGEVGMVELQISLLYKAQSQRDVGCSCDPHNLLYKASTTATIEIQKLKWKARWLDTS